MGIQRFNDLILTDSVFHTLIIIYILDNENI
jgi:hypothetical protein